MLRTDLAEVTLGSTTADTIADFNAAEGDRLAFSGEFPTGVLQFQATDVSGNGVADTVISYSETASGVTVGAIFGVLLDVTVEASAVEIVPLQSAEPLL